jgi:hypothetical protein
MQSCMGGRWGPCVGAVLPADEQCDGADNDCNGRVDDVPPRPCSAGFAGYAMTASTAAWIDGCAAPGAVVLLPNEDDRTATQGLPFQFRYFTDDYGVLDLSTNGIVSFAVTSTQYTNRPLPSTVSPVGVYPFWDDLYTRRGICFAIAGDSPSRTAVVVWDDVFFYPNRSPSTHMTFEVQLHERTNVIDVLYQRLEGEGPRATGASATIGMQGPRGSVFDQLGFNTSGVVAAGRGLRWTPLEAARTLPCRAGMQSCSGGSWGACAGASDPAPEVCDGMDNDCDGVVDDGLFRSCSTAATPNPDVGACQLGVQQCRAASWETTCRGEVVPTRELCGNARDDDCDLTVDEASGCCTPMCSGRACGPDGCDGVCGRCPAGRTCVDATGVCM